MGSLSERIAALLAARSASAPAPPPTNASASLAPIEAAEPVLLKAPSEPVLPQQHVAKKTRIAPTTAMLPPAPKPPPRPPQPTTTTTAPVVGGLTSRIAQLKQQKHPKHPQIQLNYPHLNPTAAQTAAPNSGSPVWKDYFKPPPQPGTTINTTTIATAATSTIHSIPQLPQQQRNQQKQQLPPSIPAAPSPYRPTGVIQPDGTIITADEILRQRRPKVVAEAAADNNNNTLGITLGGGATGSRVVGDGINRAAAKTHIVIELLDDDDDFLDCAENPKTARLTSNNTTTTTNNNNTAINNPTINAPQAIPKANTSKGSKRPRNNITNKSDTATATAKTPSEPSLPLGTLPVHRVIAHVDLDAFYSQVETQRDPERLAGKPVGVVQYNPYGDLRAYKPEDDRLMNESHSSLIAVNYLARAAGVQRIHSGAEARACCPDIQLVQVPTAHGKADLTIYRDAGKKVLDILARLATCERASIDECYLDLTAEAQRRLDASAGMPPFPPNHHQLHIYGSDGVEDLATWWSRPPEAWAEGERLIATGAAIVAELRQAVVDELGYTCSAGIAHTKLLAKLCSGLHKPAQQTVLPCAAVGELLRELSVPKLKSLGGQFGQRVMIQLGIEYVGQLAAVPLSRLQQMFGEKDGTRLFLLARGIDDGSVEERKLPKSTSCGKTFKGMYALCDLASVQKWIIELATEIEERVKVDLETNSRIPTHLTVHLGVNDVKNISRSCALKQTTAAAIAEDALNLVRKWANEQVSGWGITDMYIGVSKFKDVESKSAALTKYFPNYNSNGGSGVGGVQQQLASAVVPGGIISPNKTFATTSTLSGSRSSGGGGGVSGRSPNNGATTTTLSTKPRKTAAGDIIDEDFLKALPPELRKEVEDQLKFEEMRVKLEAATQAGLKRAGQSQLDGFIGGSGGVNKRPKQ